MKKFNGIHSLFKELTSHLSESERHAFQILGSSLGLLHLLLVGLIKHEELKQDIVIVLPNAKDILTWHETLQRVFRMDKGSLEICIVSHYLVWGPEKYVNHIQIKQDKLRSLHRLTFSKKRKIILTTLSALAQFTISKKSFLSSSLHLRSGQNIDIDHLSERLHFMGYQKNLRVEEKGSFSVRGGIVDIFPVQEDNPLRLELLGDELSSLRYFSVESQRSEESLDEIEIVPASDVLISKEQRRDKEQLLHNFLIEENVLPLESQALMAAFDHGERAPNLGALLLLLIDNPQATFDYLSKQSLFIFPNSMMRCLQSFDEMKEMVHHLFQKDKEDRHAVLDPDRVFLDSKKILERIRQFSNIEFENPIKEQDSIVFYWEPNREDLPKIEKGKNPSKLDEWCDFLNQSTAKGQSVVLFNDSSESAAHAYELLDNRNVEGLEWNHQAFTSIFSGQLKGGKVYLSQGFLDSSVVDKEQGVSLIPYHEVFGARQRSGLSTNKKLKNLLSSLRELAIGDLVVHIDHGIGRYKGMTLLELQGVQGDFLVIEYRDGDKVYLPVHRINLLQKYKKGDGDQFPNLDKLGGDSFKIRKARVEKSVEEIAEELLKIHAQRRVERPYLFSEPGEVFTHFVDDFPYQETPDQLRCLEEIEEDFKKPHPMDRLVVGDVGFGKTEVALRAALRVILEGAQVMFLVPTTVLCYQHFYNFCFRLEKYGVRIGQVHRFIKLQEQKKQLELFKEGKIDILMGTHKLFSKTVAPKNLGLLIIDEEQRFGVMQKERLKKIKANLDILSLSATPIPRTLHMALLGLRDISLITTPPLNRMPVRTVVSQLDERIIKMALETEILRGGQVFYVHNRVEGLEEIAEILAKLVPMAKIRVAHGQMYGQSLDKIIIDFIEQKFNVLVCTTIIESGVDMPNVNTLIVDRADLLGLAQLYQLRGRVGRSSVQAYAYFLIKDLNKVQSDAMKRLEVLSTYQELGAGFQIANHDLELRGAGNLIGRQQSGHISSVGFDLYVEMLEEKIRELSSIKVETSPRDPEIKIKVKALVPVEYINHEKERLNIYKKLFSASSVEEVQEQFNAIEDQFGPSPIEFKLLIKVALLRLQLRLLGAEAIIELEQYLFEIRISSLGETRASQLQNMLKKNAKFFSFNSKGKIYVRLSPPDKELGEGEDLRIGSLLKVLAKLDQKES